MVRCTPRVFVCSLAIALSALLPSSASADTAVSGTLSSDTTWRAANSPYVVTGTITVPSGRTLTIEPGVTVRMSARTSLDVFGTLVADGTSGAPIRFTSTEQTVTRGFWGRIYFGDSSTDAVYSGNTRLSGSVLHNVTVEGAGYLPTADASSVRMDSARPMIDAVTVRMGAAYGIYAYLVEASPNGPITIRNCDVVGTGDFLGLGYAGIRVHGQTVASIIQGNRVEAFPTGVLVFSYANTTLTGNTLIGNDVGAQLSTFANTTQIVTGNQFTNNRVGALVYGQVRATLTFTDNLVRGNTQIGASLSTDAFDPNTPPTGNTITVSRNVIADNGTMAASPPYAASGLSVQNVGLIVISGNVIDSNVTGYSGGAPVYVYAGGQTLIEDNQIAQNVGGLSGGIHAAITAGGSTTIRRNTLTRNRAATASTTHVAGAMRLDLAFLSVPLFIYDNNIVDNVTAFAPFSYAVYFEHSVGTPTLYANGNWWGTANPVLVSTMVGRDSNSAIDVTNPLSAPSTTAPVASPANLTVVQAGTTTSLNWTANAESDVIGYRVWYGAALTPGPSGTGAAQGSSPIDVGNVTTFQLTGLPLNSLVTVTAYDTLRDGIADQTEGHESWFAKSPLSVTDIVADQTVPVIVGTRVRLTARILGEQARTQFKWFIWNGSAWTTLADWSGSNSVSWTPSAPDANARVRVSARRLGSVTDAADSAAASATLDVPVVTSLVFTGLTADKIAPQAPGTAITLTATSTGGAAPLQYKWWSNTGTGWIPLTGWATGNTYTWTPAAASPATQVGVWIRSNGSTVDAPDNANSFGFIPYAIVAPALTATGITSSLPSPQAAGTSITFTAAASGGVAPYAYRWWLFNGQGWVALSGWNSSNTLAWTPTIGYPAGQIGVWVRSSGVTADAPDGAAAYTAIPFVVTGPSTPLAVTSLTANRTPPQPPGTAITFTATAANGTPPFQFKWLVYSGSGLHSSSGWSTANTFTWTPAFGSPQYRVEVWARSSGSSIDAPENANALASLAFPIAAGPLTLTGITPSVASPQTVGTSITFTPAVSGGSAPYQYKWWVLTSAGWTAMTGWTTTAPFTWTPASAFPSGQVGVWVRNAGSTADAPDSTASYGFVPFVITAAAPPPVLRLTSITTNVAAPQILGTPVTFTANATGGNSPYQYKWWVSDGVTWTPLSGWNGANTLTWTAPSANPQWHVGVWIRNAGSTADAPDNPQASDHIAFPITATSPLTFASLTSSLPAPQAANTPITFTATAAGGSGAKEYKWWVFNGTTWIAASGWNSANTFVWTPTVANASANVGVWIRHAGSTADAPDNPAAFGYVPFAVTP